MAGLFAVLVAVVVPMVSTTFVAWWALGDAFSTAGRDQILDLPFAEDNSLALGLAGLVGLVATAGGLVLWHRTRPVRLLLAALILAMIIGVVIAAGFRILTAHVHGANIGGGLVILAGPWFLLIAGAIDVLLAVLGARDRSSQT